MLHFVEGCPALVFNKTRCTIAQRLTSTPNPALWAERLPKLVFYAGVDKEFAAAEQLLFKPVPSNGTAPAAGGDVVDQFNDDFGLG